MGEVGKLILATIERKCLIRRRVIRSIGVSSQLFRDILIGRRQIPFARFEDFATALGLDEEERRALIEADFTDRRTRRRAA